MKTCAMCHVEKERGSFPLRGGKCLDCKRKIDREYYQKNKEARLAYSKKWKKENKEAWKKYKKEWKKRLKQRTVDETKEND